ncbi:hypothetical protein DPEC_G00067600 [Dallia pectoralis]|uniref:Uncharacterized protein n=1 Tax=Dallia pectoralis TaxID=75939 RepID=A0ACC2H996_DALPE|nr:hypothetical protein DPEC_G00067600 [Dallia pectoralis]
MESQGLPSGVGCRSRGQVNHQAAGWAAGQTLRRTIKALSGTQQKKRALALGEKETPTGPLILPEAFKGAESRGTPGTPGAADRRCRGPILRNTKGEIAHLMTPVASPPPHPTQPPCQ